MLPLADALEEHLSALSAERGFSRNTVAAYRRDLRQYLVFLDGRPPDPDVVEAWVAELHGRGLAPTTVARKVAALRGFHRFLVVEGIRSDDPTARLDAPPRPDAVPKALDVHEVIRLVEAPDRTTPAGRRDAALLEFLYATGSRVTEAVGLDLGDLDLDETHATVLLTGKGDRQRIVPLGGAALRAIGAWLPDRLHLAGTGTDAVFVNLRGRRLTRQGVFGVVRNAARRAGLDVSRVSPHVLRHSAATHMLEGGADLRTVQEILGHANVSTTQVYTRVSPQHLVEIHRQAHPRSR